MLQCDRCEYSSKNKEDLMNHATGAHTDDVQMCEIEEKGECLGITETVNSIPKQNEMFKCDKCEYSSENKKDLMNHTSEAHVIVQEILVENTTCNIFGLDFADGEGSADHGSWKNS